MKKNRQRYQDKVQLATQFFGCICSPKSKTKKKRKGIVVTVLDSIDGRLPVHLYPSNVKKSKKKSKVQNELRLVLI